MAGAATELAKPVMGTTEPAPRVFANAVVDANASQRGAEENKRTAGEHRRGQLTQFQRLRQHGKGLPDGADEPCRPKMRARSRADGGNSGSIRRRGAHNAFPGASYCRSWLSLPVARPGIGTAGAHARLAVAGPALVFQRVSGHALTGVRHRTAPLPRTRTSRHHSAALAAWPMSQPTPSPAPPVPRKAGTRGQSAHALLLFCISIPPAHSVCRQCGFMRVLGKMPFAPAHPCPQLPWRWHAGRRALPGRALTAMRRSTPARPSTQGRLRADAFEAVFAREQRGYRE